MLIPGGVRLLVVALAGVTLVGCGTTTTVAGSGTTTTTAAVVKQVLAVEADPPGAPGRTLTLMRYTIAGGAKLSPHIHPGVQLASIESGTLSYTVISGTATVTRAGGATESVTGPATTKLGPGDAVAENDGMVHFGANETDQPVIILASLLTEDGRDLAVTVTTNPGSTTPGTTSR